MKINTRTVWQMTDDGMHIVEQDSYEYDGDVAQCFGSSSSSTTQQTTNQQLIETETTNLSDFEGIGVADARDVQIRVTDAGAVALAQKAVIEGLDVVETVAGDAFDSNVRVTKEALDFGGSALDTVERGIRSNERTTQEAFKFGGKTINKGFNFAVNIFDKSIGTLGSAITQVADASRSDAANVLNNLVKFGAIAIGVTVLGLAIMRRG